MHDLIMHLNLKLLKRNMMQHAKEKPFETGSTQHLLNTF